MGFTTAWRSNKMSFARAATLSESTAEDLQQQGEAFDSPIYELQPYHGENGVEEAVNLLGGLYQYRTKFGFINDSETHVFESWFDGERATFYYIPEDVETGEEFRDQISEDYPDSNVSQSLNTYPQNDDQEMFEAGRAIAGARFDLMRDPIYPIKSLENGGFGTRSRGATRDPYKDIIGPLTRDDGCHIMYQLVFCPTKRGRWQQYMAGKTARNLKTKQAVLLDEREPTKAEREAAKIIEEQKSRDIFHVEMRLVVSAPTKERANSRLDDLANQINNRYRTNQNQQLFGDPASSYVPGLNGREAKSFASKVINREFHETGQIECTPEELAGLAHLPSDDVQNQHVDWTATKAGDPVPVGTPRMPWDEYDLDPMQLTPHEEQQEMILQPREGDPYWLGRGVRKGIEAGIDPDLLKLHMFVGGTTGSGKTTTLKNLFAQIMRRGHGGLFYDPKADDAKDFVSLVPKGREDDLIYIEIGGDRDQQVGFNFLEIPGDPDPETARFDEAVESLADDIEALLAQAGGDDDYWGPRMSRVVRNMARGMAKSGRKLTLLDMYYALIDEQGRQKYAQHLDDERIEWIVDYASRQLADMDDSDIEPLIGRLQQWVESDLMRSIVSHPESTFSVEEAVAEGKIIIVRDETGTGGTAGTMIATALIRRIWAAVQKRQQETHFEDPPMFYAVLDEFDKIVSGQASVAEILSLARSFNLSMIPACQDLTNQLQGQDEIKNAILGQCNTFLNFNPRREGEAREMVTRHDENLTPTDLTNIPPYQFYMRTEDDRGEQTYSYKVDAFPPTDEIVDEIARSDEEVEELIERSLETYAAERMTSEEIREESEFRSGSGGVDAGTVSQSTGQDEETRKRNEMLAAVDRAHIRQEAVNDFVSAEAVAEAWATLSNEGKNYKSQIANVVEKTGKELLEQQQKGGTVHVRLTNKGREAAGLVQDTGSGGSGGKYIHRWVLSQSKLAYERMGYQVRLPSQDEEGELPDGVGMLPVDPTEGKDLDEIHELEDQLKREYPAVYDYSGKSGQHLTIEAETTTFEKPMQTLTNLRKAVETNTFCTFTTKDGSYDEDSPEAEDKDHASLFEYWARRGERIFYATNECKELIFAREKIDGTEDRWFYNQSHKFRVQESPEELIALRPADDETAETVWRDDGDEIVLASRHSNGADTIHARFSGPDDLTNSPRESFPAYYEHNAEGNNEFHVQEGGDKSVYPSKDEMLADWTPVKAPFVPEVEFTDEDGEQNIPTEDDFDIVVMPNDDNDEYDEPMRYEQGELSPLLPEDMNMPSAVVERDPDIEEGDEGDTESEDVTDAIEAVDQSGGGDDADAGEGIDETSAVGSEEELTVDADEPVEASEPEDATTADGAPEESVVEGVREEGGPQDGSESPDSQASGDAKEGEEPRETASEGSKAESAEKPPDGRSNADIEAEAKAVAGKEPGSDSRSSTTAQAASDEPPEQGAAVDEGAATEPQASHSNDAPTASEESTTAEGGPKEKEDSDATGSVESSDAKDSPDAGSSGEAIEGRSTPDADETNATDATDARDSPDAGEPTVNGGENTPESGAAQATEASDDRDGRDGRNESGRDDEEESSGEDESDDEDESKNGRRRRRRASRIGTTSNTSEKSEGNSDD